ncbi:hypothetical protein [Vibrio phage vB_VibM_83AMN]|nr:hypothetical protein [Vibrio phage vB_VibM_83AMN]
MIIWPEDLLPSKVDVSLMSNNAIFESPITNSTQTASLSGSKLKISYKFDALNERRARRIWAIVASLDGVAGRIMLRDFSAYPIKAKGKPFVLNSNTSKKYYTSKGWDANTQVLTMGDYISVNGELKIVVQDCQSDSKGDALIYVSPSIRHFPKDNTPVIVENARGVFRLEKDENTKNVSMFYKTSFSLSFVEAF